MSSPLKQINILGKRNAQMKVEEETYILEQLKLVGEVPVAVIYSHAFCFTFYSTAIISLKPKQNELKVKKCNRCTA